MVFLSFWSGIILTFGCALFAIFRGDAALRAGGVLILALNVVTPTMTAVVLDLHLDPHASNMFADFFTTLVISFGFLYLGYRHGSIWLAPAMTIQGAELYILSQVLANGETTFLMIGDNLVSCGVALALAFGTIASARERRAQQTSPVFKPAAPTIAPAECPDPVVKDLQEAVFVFHLPQEDSHRLLNLAAEARVLPSQYVRDLISTFLDGDHYAPRDRVGTQTSAR